MRARVSTVASVLAILVASSGGSGGSAGNVAVRRDRLPPLPFTVQTKTTSCERGCDGSLLVVDSR